MGKRLKDLGVSKVYRMSNSWILALGARFALLKELQSRPADKPRGGRLKAAAKALRLQHSVPADTAWERLEGWRTGVRVVVCLRSSTGAAHPDSLRVEAWLDEPHLNGLLICHPSRAPERDVLPRIALGDKALDRRLHLEGDNPSLVRWLFEDLSFARGARLAVSHGARLQDGRWTTRVPYNGQASKVLGQELDRLVRAIGATRRCMSTLGQAHSAS